MWMIYTPPSCEVCGAEGATRWAGYSWPYEMQDAQDELTLCGRCRMVARIKDGRILPGESLARPEDGWSPCPVCQVGPEAGEEPGPDLGDTGPCGRCRWVVRYLVG